MLEEVKKTIGEIEEWEVLLMRRKEGFTLIELLIVIAIIGILAAIAIPLYRTQTIKAKLTEVTNAMSNVASAVAAYYQETNGYPTAPDISTIRGSLGVALANVTRISAMAVATGVITATVATGIDVGVDGKNLVLIPTTSTTSGDSSINWTWSSSNGMPPAYVPNR